MDYVDLDARINGLTGVISPARYLEHLPQLMDDLPCGARAFATDPDHYSFSSKRCTKDLKLRQLSLPSAEEPDAEAHFRHNCWKHDEDLTIRYTDVTDFRIGIPHGPASEDPGTVILDEILPHEDGCSHEVAFRPGTLYVVCRDLTATWVETDCPDAQRG
ncbi:hypothetical protein RB199_32125 [Streptomyces libani]|uniref:hypothetical protein n=1 Tax=Streptomyces TaxID=1883 RepID=UPI0011E0679E|nr:hypothetical protein [Streptomyces sp. WAC01526]